MIVFTFTGTLAIAKPLDGFTGDYVNRRVSLFIRLHTKPLMRLGKHVKLPTRVLFTDTPLSVSTAALTVVPAVNEKLYINPMIFSYFIVSAVTMYTETCMAGYT